MKVKTYTGGKLSQGEFDTSSFGEKVLFKTLKSSIVAYQANQRLGTAKTKGRSEVHGSGKKPWAQKHTGQARAGDKKSPLWRGGGTIFGPVPRDYRQDLPIRERRVALRSALAGKFNDGEVVVSDFESFSAPSSKSARKVLADTGVGAVGQPRRALVLLAEPRENVWKSFRNFPGVTVRTAKDVCAYDVVAGGLVLAEKSALELVAQRVGPAKTSTKREGGA
ncbi:MAG: 50S ribosomal protein L4 [Planctomycetes bacterium]|nr:50S ribosomal protein L4 [Planctomycetota bacterium]